MTMREADYLPPGTGSYIYKFGHIKNVYTLSGYNTQYTNKNVNGYLIVFGGYQVVWQIFNMITT